MSGERTGIHRLERPEGGFAMLALDQRESMRALRGPRGTDTDLRRFKSAATEILTPFASAVLLDRLYGVDDRRPAGIADGCAFILAVDLFTQSADGPVSDSVLDPEVTLEFVAGVGADALKFLVLWRSDQSAAQRADVVEPVMALGRACGLPVILEAIVRDGDGAWAASDARDRAIVAAAAEFAAFRPDLYKAEVPTHGMDLTDTTAVSREISDAIGGPWVVLSNGVEPDRFGDAVAASCAGGASGFLAGRAVWSQAAALADYRASLTATAVPTLQQLGTRVPAAA